MMNPSIEETLLFWPCQRDPVGGLWVVDETRLPTEISFLPIRHEDDAVDIIRQMKTRAFGQFLVLVETLRLVVAQAPVQDITQRLTSAIEKLNASRPTFPFSDITNLLMRWWRQTACDEEARRIFLKRTDDFLQHIRTHRLHRVERLASLFEDGDRILTHCHVSGELAMAAALARRQDRCVLIVATETRPYCQGARLTCFELDQLGVDHALIADAAAVGLMAKGMINKLVVGSDRNCANGDFANKVGTFSLIAAARRFQIKVIVLTQPSRTLKTMQDIPIEIRPQKELLSFQGKPLFEEEGIEAFYPSFDRVPGKWIDEAVPLTW